MSDDLVLPHNLDAERSVLGAILVNNDAYSLASATVAHADFYRDAHSRLFAAMATLHERGDAIDFVTLKEALIRSGDLDRVGGPAYVSSLVDGMPRATNIEYYARIVREKAALRRVIDAAQRATKRAYAQEDSPEDIVAGAARDLASCGFASGDQADSDPIFESAGTFLGRHGTDLVDEWCIERLIPVSGITMIHGQPRDWKSLIALSLAVSIATTTPALGNSSLRVQRARIVGYLTEEDASRRVAYRLRGFLAGMGLDNPGSLYVAACRGLNLDDPRVQDSLIAWSRGIGCEVLFIDPVRSVTACADQGPRELKPFASFLRRLIRETGCTVVLVHHDVKPIVGQQDTRRRPQRASGGGIFSIADNPISVDRVDDERRLLVPNAFKFGESPPPVTVRMEAGDGFMRLVAETGTAASAEELELHARIVDYLGANPHATGNTIQKGLKVRRDAVFAALDELAERGTLDCVQKGRGKYWFVAGSVVPEPAGTMEPPVEPDRFRGSAPIGGTTNGNHPERKVRDAGRF